MQLPPISDMLIFVDIVDQKSFTKAAKLHKVTPASLSKRILFLESQLGLKLLNRTTRKLNLTEAGEILYNSCKEIYESTRNAYNLVLESHKSPYGDIAISAPTNFSNVILSPLIAEFLKKYPSINIKVILDDSRGLPQKGEYDIAIRAGNFEDNSAIIKKFSSIHFVTFASPKYFSKNGIPKTPNDLKNHNCIDYSYRNEGAVWFFKKNKELFHIPIKGNLFSNNANFIKMIALKGVGIAHLPSFMVEDELKRGDLVLCLKNYETQKMPISLIYNYSSKLLPKRMNLLIDFLMSKMTSSKQ